MQVKVMMYNIVAPFDCKYPTFYLIAIVMFALYLTVYEIFADEENFQNNYLENEGQGQRAEERDLRHSIRNVRIHASECFQICSYIRTYVYENGYTHIHTHRERQERLL